METTFIETDFGVEPRVVLNSEEAESLVHFIMRKRGEHYSDLKQCPTWEVSDSLSAIQFGNHFMLSTNDQENRRYYYEVDERVLRDVCDEIKQTKFSYVRLRFDPAGILGWDFFN